MPYIPKIPRIGTKLSRSVKHIDEDDLKFDKKLEIFEDKIQDSQNLEKKSSQTKKNNLNDIKFITNLENDKFNKNNELKIPNLKLPLKPHQIEAVNWMISLEDKIKNEPNSYNVRGGILSDAPGLGKTLSTLCLCIKKEIDNPEDETDFPNLVICPKIVVDEWCNAIDKFFGDKYPYICLKPNKMININLEEIKKYKFVITNYEFINSIMKEFYGDFLEENKKNKEIQLRKPLEEQNLINKKGRELLVDINWNRVICDESHRLNNSTSLTFLSLINVISKRRWCLTGTPIRNYEKDIYHQFLFLGYNHFVEKNRFTYNQYRTDKLHKHVLKRSYTDVDIDMPEFEEKNINIELTEYEMKFYKNVNESLKIAYKEFSNGYSSFSNVLHLFLRLRQMCVSSFAMVRQLKKLNDKNKTKNDKIKYKNEDDTDASGDDIEILKEMHYIEQIHSIKNFNAEHLSNLVEKLVPDELIDWVDDKYGSAGYMSSKINAIIKILNEINNNEKVLIYTCFKTHMDIIQEAIESQFGKNVLILNGDFSEKERQDVLSTFKKSNTHNIMIINYKLGSEGLNLMEANNVILCENWWCPSVMEQAKHRAYRIGQKRKVYIYNIITKNTIEEKIKKICDKKEDLSKSFMNDVFDTFKQKDYKLNSSTLKRIIF